MCVCVCVCMFHIFICVHIIHILFFLCTYAYKLYCDIAMQLVKKL